MKKTASITIIDALRDRKLFGSLFADLSTWQAWIAWLKAVFGLSMDETELALYQQCTARQNPPISGIKEAYAVVGRRGGKSRIVAFAAVYIACFHDFRKYLAPGERGMVLTIARDRDQSKVVFNYVSGILDAVPALKRMIIRQTADEIDLSNGITIAVKTSDYRAVRGVTVVLCVADEVCFWDSQGVNPDKEIFQALRPAMATIPEAKLLVISSPYAKAGVVFEAHRRYFGKDDAPVLVWQAATRTMNPNITEAFIQAEIENDPDAARSEWLAQFREDVEAAFSIESIEQCVVPGRTELMAAGALGYVAFVDPSGGRRDQFTVAIAHRQKDKAIVDCVRAWKPPFNPEHVTEECAKVLKPYRIHSVTGDAYGGEWPRDAFRKYGIHYEVSEKNRSQLYLELIPAVNSQRVELPDIRQMKDELRRLERRRGKSGKDTVDHPPMGSDDVANAVAGAINLIISKPGSGLNSYPVGVGRGIGADMRRAGLGGAMSEPNPFNGPPSSMGIDGRAERRPNGYEYDERTMGVRQSIPVPIGVGNTGWNMRRAESLGE
jgi:hypothetical protein